MSAATALATITLVVGLSASAATATTGTGASSPAVVAARPAAAPSFRTAAAPWEWPLPPLPRVVHPFDKPPTPYAAGHRGVDLAGTVGVEVTAVADGVVTHVGVIAGRGTVTITHPGDMRSTYEPVTSSLAYGASVTAGEVIGTLDSAGSHCAPVACLHLGALRRGTAGVWEYVDPLFLLRDVEVILLRVGTG